MNWVYHEVTNVVALINQFFLKAQYEHLKVCT